jgi:hypothetical protein
LAIKAAIKRRIASIECDDALILPHRANPAGSDFRERQVATYLKVAWQQIVRAFVTTPIDFGCGCVDPFTVNIEGAQQASLIEAQVRLNSLQCVFAHEKRSLHRTIVPPKPNSAPRRIISAALIWKTKRHQSHIAWSISPAWFTLNPHEVFLPEEHQWLPWIRSEQRVRLSGFLIYSSPPSASFSRGCFFVALWPCRPRLPLAVLSSG